MEFHHINGNPDYRVSNLLGNSLKRLKEEIDKCVLVCANCHSEIHEGITQL
jgi:hypothetical protein